MDANDRLWIQLAWEYIKLKKPEKVDKAGALGVDLFKVAKEIREGYEDAKKKAAKSVPYNPAKAKSNRN